MVSPPAWLIVFTGKGKAPDVPLTENGTNVHLFYWNLEKTIFNLPGIVPVAFKINTILTGYNVPSDNPKQIANK